MAKSALKRLVPLTRTVTRRSQAYRLTRRQELLTELKMQKALLRQDYYDIGMLKAHWLRHIERLMLILEAHENTPHSKECPL